jgi:hypothetical protein
MATSCVLQPGCSSAPADLRRISANNTPPRPSQSLGACHPYGGIVVLGLSLNKILLSCPEITCVVS